MEYKRWTGSSFAIESRHLNYDRSCIRIINSWELLFVAVYLLLTWWIPVRSMIRCVYVSVSRNNKTAVTFLLLLCWFCCCCCSCPVCKKYSLDFRVCVCVHSSFFYNFVLLIETVSYRAHTLTALRRSVARTNKMLRFRTSVARWKTNWQLNTIFALDILLFT